MGKFFKSMGRGLKLGFKTVTFHWKQYFCFFMAILAMEIMFGIVVMSSSKNIEQYISKTNSQYDYHFAMTNLPKEERAWFEQKINSLDVTPYSVKNENGFLYVEIHTDYELETAGPTRSVEYYYNEFVSTYVNRMPTLHMKPKDVQYLMSPLYNMDSKILGMRLECAAKLLVLAVVSIAVIILLLNIRLNHFKFTYGIYMSYGADSKKLFSTSFWEMLVIGILMFIPSALISIAAAFFLYAPAGGMAVGELTQFLLNQATLVFWVLLFIIPICIIAVWIPIKITASQPPLKLLIAQDNSNLVSSPRISSQLLGKKFPGSYESLGLFRFRRYIATLVASSVLFASAFVWIYFFGNIYDFNTKQEQAEFTITVNNEMEVVEEYIGNSPKRVDVTSDYKKLRDKIYDEHYLTAKLEAVRAFEDFYTARYVIVRAPEGTVVQGKDASGRITHVYAYDDTNHQNDLYKLYRDARNAIVKEAYQIGGTGEYGKNFLEFEEYLTDGCYADGTNNPKVEYEQVKSDVLRIVDKVYRKEYQKTYKYPDNLLATQNAKEIALEGLIDGYTLLKHIDFELYKSENDKENKATVKSNYIYAAFNDDLVKGFSGFEYNNQTEKRVTDNVELFPLDKREFNLTLLNQKYTLDKLNPEDDLSLTDMKTVGSKRYAIISETAANSQVLNLKPGDTFTLNYISAVKGTYDETLKGDDLLSELIKNETFNEVEYIVYAVIKDMPTSENIPIYLLEDEYEFVTGVNPIPNKFSVYVPSTTTATAINDLYVSLAEWGVDYATVTWNNTVAENRETIDMKNLPVIQTIALFSLMLSPLFWFFSQIMFYGKREEEFRMLRGLGATEKEIKKIFRKDGLILSAIGIIATVLMSILGVFIIHKLNMTYVAFFDQGALTLYRFDMPWIAILIALAVTAVCAYMSTVIPYRIDRKKAKKAVSREFGEE